MDDESRVNELLEGTVASWLIQRHEKKKKSNNNNASPPYNTVCISIKENTNLRTDDFSLTGLTFIEKAHFSFLSVPSNHWAHTKRQRHEGELDTLISLLSEHFSFITSSHFTRVPIEGDIPEKLRENDSRK